MEDSKHFYVNKERMIRVEGVALKIKLNEKDYEVVKDKNVDVDQNDAAPWIKRSLVGNIVKADLDEERKKETNSLDLMQNSSIIYHTESILEMQIACLILCYILNTTWAPNFEYNVQEDESDKIFKAASVNSVTRYMMYAFLIEHLMSYTFGIFRNYELNLRGEPNENGIESAPIETVLRYIEISVDFAIFTVVIMHFLHLTAD